MMHKCKECDKKNETTIDTLSQEYIYDNKEYFHKECYMNMLMRDKKMSKEDAIVESTRIYLLNLNETTERDSKDKINIIVKNLYNLHSDTDTKALSLFYMTLEKVRNGNYKKNVIKYRITFTELYEMYSNQKMIQKLESIAYSKNVEREDRLMWDLAVMVNEYPNYLKFKRKTLRDSDSCKEAIENMRKYKISSEAKYKATREKTIEENKNSVKIDDIIDDMFAD